MGRAGRVALVATFSPFGRDKRDPPMGRAGRVTLVVTVATLATTKKRGMQHECRIPRFAFRHFQHSGISRFTRYYSTDAVSLTDSL